MPSAARTVPLVAVRLPPGAAGLRLLDSVWAAGAAVLPLSHRAPASEVEATIASLRPARLVDATGDHEIEGGGIPVPPGTAVVIATSGTTGTPKGVVLSRDALAAAAEASARALDRRSGDRWLCPLPLDRIAGLMIVARARLWGHEPVILDRPDPSELVRVASETTLTSMVPAMVARLLAAKVDLSGWRSILVGGDALAPGLRDAAAAAGARIVETYGMTETCGGVVYDGRPLEGVAVDLSDAGELLIAGSMLMTEYRLDPAGTAAALRGRWLHTGDWGEVREGTVTVWGRRDDVIVTGGHKVAPREVEAALAGCPGVREVAVVGLPDDRWGMRVTAFVVPGEGPPALGDIRSWLSDRLSPFKIPRALHLVEAIPRSPTGEPKRSELVARRSFVVG